MKDAVKMTVVVATGGPQHVQDAKNFQWFRWKDGSGVFVKLGPDKFLYLTANQENPHAWVGNHPAPGLHYMPVTLTVHTHEDAESKVSACKDYGEQ